MKKSFIYIIFITLFSVQNASAGYDSNMKGIVTSVLTYTGGDQIYFILDNQPSTHPTCNASLFSIDAGVPSSRRQQVLSRLLTAHATGKPVNIGYDSQGDCSHSYIRVHRVG